MAPDGLIKTVNPKSVVELPAPVPIAPGFSAPEADNCFDDDAMSSLPDPIRTMLVYPEGAVAQFPPASQLTPPANARSVVVVAVALGGSGFVPDVFA